VLTNLKVNAKWIGAGLVLLVVTFGVGYGTCMYTRPAKIEYRKTIKMVEDTTKKTVEDKDEHKVVVEDKKVNKNKDLHIIITEKEVKKVDGEVEKTKTTVIDNTDKTVTENKKDVNNTLSDDTNISEADHKEVTKDTVKIITSQPDWYVGVSGGVDPFSFIGQPSYSNVIVGLEVKRRVLGPIWLGVNVSSNLDVTSNNKTVLLTAGVTF
jgi:hypothetical protein